MPSAIIGAGLGLTAMVAPCGMHECDAQCPVMLAYPYTGNRKTFEIPLSKEVIARVQESTFADRNGREGTPT
jgi:hypothetical protein